MTVTVHNSFDIFDQIDKQYFPYYALYKDRLAGTDTLLFSHPKCPSPLGVALVRDGDRNDTLHIACLEIAEPIQHQGWGSKVLDAIKNKVNGIYSRITLRCAKPELISFYEKNGFRIFEQDGPIIMMEADI